MEGLQILFFDLRFREGSLTFRTWCNADIVVHVILTSYGYRRPSQTRSSWEICKYPVETSLQTCRDHDSSEKQKYIAVTRIYGGAALHLWQVMGTEDLLLPGSPRELWKHSVETQQSRLQTSRDHDFSQKQKIASRI